MTCPHAERTVLTENEVFFKKLYMIFVVSFSSCICDCVNSFVFGSQLPCLLPEV